MSLLIPSFRHQKQKGNPNDGAVGLREIGRGLSRYSIKESIPLGRGESPSLFRLITLS